MNQNKELVKILEDVAQYVIDGTFIIAQGIACLRDSSLRDGLTKIKDKYEEGVEKLSDLIVNYGGKAPEHTRDFKGFFMQGYTGMRGLISDQGVMKALATNTKMFVTAFETALKNVNISDEIQTVLQDMLDEAKQHLDYFNNKSENSS